ncbi:MAG: DNA-3-methyladenine glycosylase [bacterium]|nr:DNA-3-methyladenine glycosylase [bacterium]
MKNKNIIGVKTTKIYCLPTCPAREPLPQNIIRFKSAAQAERNGFRPCKRCFPDFPYGKWLDEGASVLLMPPREFDFLQCLKFLTRSPLEPCHAVENNILYKLEKFEGKPALLKIQCRDQNTISIDFLTPRPKKSIRAKVAKYVWHWFDLDTNLRPFFRMAGKDPVLKNVAKDLYGLRILTISDLFEAICWAIIGQQINLAFAYTLKKRFVESFGETFYFDNTNYYLFPTPQVISRQTVADLRCLQLTGKKSEYIIELAQKINPGELTKKKLLDHMEFERARKELMQLRGVGQWTADYVSLRCLLDPAAFPIADVGLQNAVKQQLGLSKKPAADDIIRYSRGWKSWQAYASFYLWASLI